MLVHRSWMRIYQIDKISSDLAHCMVSGTGTVHFSHELSNGRPPPKLPDDFRELMLTLDEADYGRELTDLLGCTNPMLLIRGAVYDALAAKLRFDPIQTHRFRLLDAEGRPHSDDYLIVNPLDPRPCMSREHSDVLENDTGRILRVRKLVLEADKLPPRDLFRAAESPKTYLVSERFVDAVTVGGYTNFKFKPVASV